MQTGGLYPVYGMQTGQGFLGALGRMIIPAIKSVARVAAPAAKKMVKSAAKDLLTAGVTTGLEALEVRQYISLLFTKISTNTTS